MLQSAIRSSEATCMLMIKDTRLTNALVAWAFNPKLQMSQNFLFASNDNLPTAVQHNQYEDGQPFNPGQPPIDSCSASKHPFVTVFGCAFVCITCRYGGALQIQGSYLQTCSLWRHFQARTATLNLSRHYLEELLDRTLNGIANSLVQSVCTVGLSPCVHRAGHCPENSQRELGRVDITII